MYWQKRFNRKNKDQEIEQLILEIRAQHKDYGYKRIHRELRKTMVVNIKKVHRIVKKLGLQVKSFSRKSRKYNSYKGNVGKTAKNRFRQKFYTSVPHQKIATDTSEFKLKSFSRKSRKYNSYKGNVGKTAKNRFRQKFYTSVPHQKIATDTSEFKCYEKGKNGEAIVKKLYLDAFMDMYNSEILSFSISERPTANNVMSALNKAIEVTSDCKYRRTFHSDQGWAYQMNLYRNKLKKERIFQSMSRKGNCLDNAVMENFFGILKQEIYYGYVYNGYNELKLAIENYIKYYNEKRIKAKLGWMSPIEYRLRLSAA